MITGIYVEKMATKGLEVIIGMNRDPQFGPMLMFGLGGIFVEVVKDVTFHLAPISEAKALGSRFFSGIGGQVDFNRGAATATGGEAIIAVGRYYLNEKSNRAEVAFVIRDEWQNRGLGTFLCKHLIKIAKRNGIAGFPAVVLRDNRRMQAIFNHSGYTVESRMKDDVYSYRIDFT